MTDEQGPILSTTGVWYIRVIFEALLDDAVVGEGPEAHKEAVSDALNALSREDAVGLFGIGSVMVSFAEAIVEGRVRRL